MQAMTIRNNRVLAILLMVVGSILGFVSILTMSWQAFVGVLLLVLGILMLINPMVRLENGEVQLCNPLGMRLRRFPVQSPADLHIDGKKLIHRPTGKKIITLAASLHKPDVEQLRAQIEQPQAPQQAHPGQPPQAAQFPEPPAQPSQPQEGTQGQFPEPPAQPPRQ